MERIKNLSIVISTFFFAILINTFPVFAQTNFTITPVVIIDFFGVVVGIISVVIIYSVIRTLGGIIGKSFTIVIYGILLQVFAIIYTIIFARFKIFPIPGGVDIHHLLMVIGLLFFVVAAYNAAKLSKSQ